MTDTVVHDEAGQRYVLMRGEQELGSAYYESGKRGEIVFTHTEVDPELHEHGLGSTLVKAALDDVAANSSARVVASCPFVYKYIAEHDEYQPLTSR
jgi:predicted GNAT family acetyltransferase